MSSLIERIAIVEAVRQAQAERRMVHFERFADFTLT